MLRLRVSTPSPLPHEGLGLLHALQSDTAQLAAQVLGGPQHASLPLHDTYWASLVPAGQEAGTVRVCRIWPGPHEAEHAPWLVHEPGTQGTGVGLGAEPMTIANEGSYEIWVKALNWRHTVLRLGHTIVALADVLALPDTGVYVPVLVHVAVSVRPPATEVVVAPQAPNGALTSKQNAMRSEPGWGLHPVTSMLN